MIEQVEKSDAASGVYVFKTVQDAIDAIAGRPEVRATGTIYVDSSMPLEDGA